MVKVQIIESERGWGQKVDEVKEFSSREEAQKYWGTTVDKTGKVYDGYGSGKISRAEYHASKVMQDFYDKNLVGEVEKMAKELRAKIPETISQEISKTVLKHLNK